MHPNSIKMLLALLITWAALASGAGFEIVAQPQPRYATLSTNSGTFKHTEIVSLQWNPHDHRSITPPTFSTQPNETPLSPRELFILPDNHAPQEFSQHPNEWAYQNWGPVDTQSHLDKHPVALVLSGMVQNLRIWSAEQLAFIKPDLFSFKLSSRKNSFQLTMEYRF